MASDSSSVSFSFPTRGITHFITDTQSTTERVEEKEQTNKRRLGSAPSARKGVCDIVNSLCICRLSQACILRETSTKTANNADIFSRHCRLTGLSSRLSDFRWLSSLLCLHLLPPSADCLILWTATHADCPPLPTVVNWSLCLLSDLPSLLHFRPHRRFRPQSFVWVSHQTDKEIVWVAPTQTETNCYALCHSWESTQTQNLSSAKHVMCLMHCEKRWTKSWTSWSSWG